MTRINRLSHLWIALLLAVTGVICIALTFSPNVSARPAAQEVALVISKTEDRDPVPAGEWLVYTITYQNPATETVTGVIVTDTLDPALSYQSADPEPDGGLPGAPYWNIGELTPSATGEIVLTVTVSSQLPNGAVVTNTAVIAGTDAPPQSVQITTTVAAPVLQISKKDHPDPVVAGAPLTYTIFYTNAGGATASGVRITDVLDSRVVYAGASPSPSGGTPGAPYWDIGPLTPSHSDQIVVSVTVPGGLGDAILTNVVYIGSNQTAPQSFTETTEVLSHGAPVSLALAPPTAAISAGQSVSYTLTAYDTYNNSWDVTAAGSYTITPAAGGLWVGNRYTASVAGTWTVTATYGGLSSTALLTVTPGPLASIALSPKDATIAAGQTQTYTTTAYDSFGNSRGNVTTDTTFSILESGHGGSWMGNVYFSGNPGTWTVQGLYSGLTDTAVLTVQAPILTIIKTDGPDPVDAGATLAYTLTLQNAGNEVATGVVVTDVLDSRVGFVSADPPAQRVGQTLTWTLASLPPGAPTTFRVTVTVTSPLTNGTVLTNLAYLDSDQTLPVSTVQTTTVRSSPVLTVTKTDGPDPVDAGATLAYTLTLQNAGNEVATGVIVTDVLDSRVGFVSADPPAQRVGQTLTWTLASLPPGAPTTFRVTVTVTSPLTNGTVLTNLAFLDSDQTLPLSTTQTTTVRSSPVLTVTKRDNPDPVIAGEVLYYTIVITNTGNENPTNVVVTETYDANVSFVSANPPPKAGSGNRRWEFATIPVGSPQSIEVIVRVASPLPVGTVLTNQVTLDTDQTPPQTITETTRVQSEAQLRITQVDDPDPVAAGGELVYSIVCKNTGNAPANGVRITDTYDSRVSFISANPSPTVGNNVWVVGTLPAGDSFGPILVRVRVNSPLPNGSLLTNRVTVSSNEFPPADFITTTQVTSAPAITLTVADSPDPVPAGSTLTYTLRYTNTGNADATNAVITATLDPRVSFADASPPPSGGGGSIRVWNLGTVPGEGGWGQVVLRVTVTSPLTNGTVLTFSARLTDAEGDERNVSAQTTVTSAPVLSLGKSDGVTVVYAGDRLTYTLTVTNSGNENAYNIAITDTLPNYIEYLGCQIDTGTCQRLGNLVVFQVPALPAPTSQQAQVVVQVNNPLEAGADRVVNRARMTAPSLSAPIEVEDIDIIGSRPDLWVNVTHAPSLFSPNRAMVYTITYGNVGAMHAANAVITTVLPTATIYIGGGWHAAGGQVYTYSVGTLLAGSTGPTVTLVISHVQQPNVGATQFSVPFTIGNPRGDARPEDNTRNVLTGVPDLVITDFQVEPLPIQAHKPVTFTVVIQNQGTGMAWNPDNNGGFWVDVFIAPVASYPFERYSEKNIYASPSPLAPGARLTMTISYTAGFAVQEVQAFYVKVDNHGLYPYGLVPESNEWNNVAGPIAPEMYRVYLPLVCRGR